MAGSPEKTTRAAPRRARDRTAGPRGLMPPLGPNGLRLVVDYACLPRRVLARPQEPRAALVQQL